MGALLTQFMNRYAYTDFHELNADWIIKTMMELINQVENFVSLNAIKYADPIQWNITKQYEKNTVVIDPLTGVAYISVTPVPMGVALTNTDYWTVVFDLGSFVVRAAKNFTNRYEADTTLTATFASNQGDWLVWGDTLYEVIVPIINAGDQYVVDSNIRHFTMEEVADALAQAIQAVDTKVGDLDDLNSSDKTSIVNAINSVLSDLNIKIGDLTLLDTNVKTDVVSAINDELAYLKSIAINVVEEGADNTGTDDCSALISTLAATYHFLYFPSGTYKFDNPITIYNSNVSFLGDNATINRDGYAIVLNDTVGNIIKGFTFNGVKALDNCAININSGNQIKIFNCTFDTLGYGVNTYLSKQINVDDCIFNNVYYGVVFDGTTKYTDDNGYNSVTNCRTSNIEREGIYFRYCERSIAEGNYNSDSGSFAIAANLSRFITITNNYSEMSAGEAYNLQDCEMCKITHNIAIWFPASPLYGVTRGVDFGTSIWGTAAGSPENVSDNNEISFNLIIDSNKAGVGISDDTRNDLIMGNRIISCGHNTNPDDGGLGAIGVSKFMGSNIAPSATRIINNIIIGTAYYGIFLKPGDHWATEIFDNIIRSVTSSYFGITLPSDLIEGNNDSFVDVYTPTMTNANLITSSCKYVIDGDIITISGYLAFDSATQPARVSLPFNVVNGVLLNICCTTSTSNEYHITLETASDFTLYGANGSTPPDGNIQFTISYKFM